MAQHGTRACVEVHVWITLELPMSGNAYLRYLYCHVAVIYQYCRAFSVWYLLRKKHLKHCSKWGFNFFYCFMRKWETTLKTIPFSFYLCQSQTVWTLDATGVRPGGSPRQKLLKDALAAKELQTMEKHLAGTCGSEASCGAQQHSPSQLCPYPRRRERWSVSRADENR